MKSRREMLSGLLTDICKAVFIAFGLGKFVTPNLVTWQVALSAIIFMIGVGICAWNMHPETEVDKELKLWK